MRKKTMTMAAVFKDLPRGYWRTADNVTVALKDMHIEHLENVHRFLVSKRAIFNLILSNPEDNDDLVGKCKFPSDWDYLIKILEVAAEIHRRGRECEDKREWKQSSSCLQDNTQKSLD